MRRISTDKLPSRQLPVDFDDAIVLAPLAMVLGVDINSYKIVVDGTVGWVDKQDVCTL